MKSALVLIYPGLRRTNIMRSKKGIRYETVKSAETILRLILLH